MSEQEKKKTECKCGCCGCTCSKTEVAAFLKYLADFFDKK